MKNFLLSLLFLPLLLSGITPTEEVEHDFIGIWHDQFNNESLQITRNNNFDIQFTRVSGYNLKSKGLILSSHEGLIEVERYYPQKETYTLKYVFSPSKEILVITKPNDKEAWVFTRHQ